MNISILWGGESQAYVIMWGKAGPLDMGTNCDDIVVFIFPLELEKQSDASVIIKPFLSLKKPVFLFDKICNWPSY